MEEPTEAEVRAAAKAVRDAHHQYRINVPLSTEPNDATMPKQVFPDAPTQNRLINNIAVAQREWERVRPFRPRQ